MGFQPIIKWCGSKRVQSSEIVSYFPQYMDTYYEPFCGGCSVLYQLMISEEKFASDFVCSDINPDLIDLWNAIKDYPDEILNEYDKMWNEMNSLEKISEKKEYYNEIRDDFNLTRNPSFFFFLMRTCTNGVPRYNIKQEFNNTFHLTRKGMSMKRLKPLIMNWSELLNENEVTFKCCDYKKILKEVGEGDFIYLDPPYRKDRSYVYFGKFDYSDFFNQLIKLNSMEQKYILSFDGNPDEPITVPEDCYENHVYVTSLNGSYRKILEKMTNEDTFESLYWN